MWKLHSSEHKNKELNCWKKKEKIKNENKKKIHSVTPSVTCDINFNICKVHKHNWENFPIPHLKKTNNNNNNNNQACKQVSKQQTYSEKIKSLWISFFSFSYSFTYTKQCLVACNSIEAFCAFDFILFFNQLYFVSIFDFFRFIYLRNI